MLRSGADTDPRYRTGHWQRLEPELGKFDLIVGSDVPYECSQPQDLADFIHGHAAAQVDVLIVDPDRGNRSAFRRAMERSGSRLTETRLDEPLADGTPVSRAPSALPSRVKQRNASKSQAA